MPVAIHHPQDPTRPTVIPDAMYDPEIHKLWVDRGTYPGLPDDLPGRSAFISAGYYTLAAVRACRDFDEVPGIGQATEARLVAYLARSYGETGPERPESAPPSSADTPTGPGESEVPEMDDGRDD